MRYLNYLWEQYKYSSSLVKFTILAVLMIWVVAFGMAMIALFLLWERPAIAQPVTPGPTVVSPVVTLAPTSGAANTPVTISGQGWTPGGTVLIYLTDPNNTGSELGELAVESAVVDPAGRFIAMVPMVTQPHWVVPGLVRVVVRTVEGDVAGQAFFSLLEGSAESVETATPTTTTTPTPTTGSTPIVGSPTVTPQPGTSGLTTVTDLNIRSGPGTGYAILGLMRAGQSAEITGVSPDGRWWQIAFSGTNEGRGWVAAQYVNAANTANVPVVQNYPHPPTPVPQPTATPRQPATPVVITDWRGEYYNNVTMSGNPVVIRNDVAVDFNWGKAAPVNGVGADNFSARWTRSVPFPAGNYRFTVRADDGVLFWIDDRLIIDQWHDGSATTYTADVSLTEGLHSLKVAYYERTGDAVVQLRWDRVNTYPDWKGEYYNNPNLSGAPALVRNDGNISFNWGEGSPAAGLPADNFSARWTREVYFPAGNYRFTVRVDDGARLWIDNNLVIDQWRDSSLTSYAVDVNLSEGSHTLRLEYYDRWYNATVRLEWQRVDSFDDWKAEYFNNRHLQGNPVLVRNEEEIDHNWGEDAPASQVPADNFSARWTRRLGFQSATYLFEVEVDDGVRFWFDDKLLIDAWEDGSARKYQVRHQVQEGQHRLRLEYYDRTDDAEIELSWRKDNTPANQPPQAAPGGPYTVAEGGQLTLDGRASRDVDGTIVKYEWDLNYDGSVFRPQAEGATVNQKYGDGPATRAVALRVTDNNGASRVGTTWVQIQNVAPAVEAGGPYTGQVGSGVTFTGTASDPSPADQAALAYTWDFGDGTKANGPVVNHAYAQAGTYNVKLTVVDKDGGQGVDTTTVQIGQNNRPPQAVISGPNNGQVGTALQFSGSQSSDPDGKITSYLWNFGDGNSGEGVNVSHTYGAPGSYEVRLTVKDNDGLTHNSTIAVQIKKAEPANQPPVAVIAGPKKGLVDETLTFGGGQSTDSDGQIVAYTWDFGDGSRSNERRVEHIYKQQGDYQVTLTVTDDGGLTGRTSIMVKIEEPVRVTLPPNAVIAGPQEGVAGEALTFGGGESNDPDGQVVAYHWNFGDGTESNERRVEHIYQQAGDYLLTLTVTDNDGLINDAQITVKIKDPAPGNLPPTAIISGTTTAVVGEPVVLRGGASSDSDGRIIGYAWNLGDGTITHAISTTHIYGAPGEYQVSLTVKDDGGLTANASKVITVTAAAPPPVANPGSQERRSNFPQ